MSDVETIRRYLGRASTTTLNANAARVLLDSRDDWRKRAEKLLGELDETEKQLAATREALTKAHACATLREDGTCEGCFVSEVLKGTAG